MICPLRIFLNWYGGKLVKREAREIQQLMKEDTAKAHLHILGFKAHINYTNADNIYISDILNINTHMY